MDIWEQKVCLYREKTIFVGKCAISGNNHFFAFLISSWCVDDTSLGWEVVIGLAFFLQNPRWRPGSPIPTTSVYLNIYFVLDTVE